MKFEIIVDPHLEETTVKVYARSEHDAELIQSYLDPFSTQRLMGIKEDKIVLLEPHEIVRFYTKDKKVYAQTLKDSYVIRLRMYDLEERLIPFSFIRISQGELINLDYLKRLDLRHKGTIAVEFKTGDISYVSRRSLKEFKKALGI